MFVGSMLSGVAADYFGTSSGATANWRGFWFSSAAGSAAILLLIAIFFQGRSRIHSKG